MSLALCKTAAPVGGRVKDHCKAGAHSGAGPALVRFTALIAVMTGATCPALAAEPAPLVLESTIALGNVRGRIDHLASDVDRQLLYVAELGNDSVGVVDLKHAVLLRSIAGLREPQGVAYIPTVDLLYVANAGDGSLRVFKGADLVAVDKIDLGDDADNIRFDKTSNRVYVGYGGGALGVIDPVTRKKIVDIPLQAHPESFQLESNGRRIWINVPDKREIAVVDRVRQKQVASWKTGDLAANFPLALDETNQQALVVFRHPAMLAVMALKDGAVLSRVETCSDADDVFYDDKRQRVYVSCGEGFIDTFARRAGVYERASRTATAPGARTSLYDPGLDRLFVAARATAAAPAAILILRPSPLP